MSPSLRRLREENSKTFVCDKHDRAITKVLFAIFT